MSNSRSSGGRPKKRTRESYHNLNSDKENISPNTIPRKRSKHHPNTTPCTTHNLEHIYNNENNNTNNDNTVNPNTISSESSDSYTTNNANNKCSALRSGDPAKYDLPIGIREEFENWLFDNILNDSNRYFIETWMYFVE